MKRDARKGRGGDGFGCETAARGPSASFLRNWFFWSNHKVRRYTIGKQSDGIDNDIGFLILGFSAQVPGFRA